MVRADPADGLQPGPEKRGVAKHQEILYTRDARGTHMLRVQVKAHSKILAFHIRRAAVRHTTFCCFGVVVVLFSLGERGERERETSSIKLWENQLNLKQPYHTEGRPLAK